MNTVELYDASAPGRPAIELSANFDPRTHTKWDYRPSVVTRAWHEIEVGDGDKAEALCTDTVSEALHESGYLSAADVIRAGAAALRKVDGVGVKTAKALLDWCAAEVGKDIEAEAEAAEKDAPEPEPEEEAEADGGDPPADPQSDPPAEDPPGEGGSEG